MLEMVLSYANTFNHKRLSQIHARFIYISYLGNNLYESSFLNVSKELNPIYKPPLDYISMTNNVLLNKSWF